MPASNEPLVSVVVPCYNAAAFVGETIESALSQRGCDSEVIVLDDGSSDGSWDVIRSYGARVRAARLPHRGGCHARNAGARMARGRFLMFLDSDDLIAPDTLRSLAAALAGRRYAVAACSWRRLRWTSERWLAVDSGMPSRPADGDVLRGWMCGWYVPPCALLWTRAAFERTGGWDEELTANQDGDIMLRALLAGVALVTADGGGALYRDHEGGRLTVGGDVFSEHSIRSRMRVLEKLAAELQRQGRWDGYAGAVGTAYHNLAALSIAAQPELARECLRRAEQHASRSVGSRTAAGRMLQRALGLAGKERVAQALARVGIMTGTRRRVLRLRRMYESARGPSAE